MSDDPNPPLSGVIITVSGMTIKHVVPAPLESVPVAVTLAPRDFDAELAAIQKIIEEGVTVQARSFSDDAGAIHFHTMDAMFIDGQSQPRTTPSRPYLTIGHDGKITWPDDITETERLRAIAALKSNGYEVPAALAEGRL